jgi:uncharacterized protein
MKLVEKRQIAKRRGLAWLLRQVSQALAPTPPFHDHRGRKGVFTPFTMPPPHRMTRIAINRPGIRAPWRIALVADLHAGGYSHDLERLARIMAQIDRTAPDLVLLLGDYVNMMGFGGGRIPPEAIAPILRFPAARHGVYAVLGNHDWEYGFADVRGSLEGQGIGVLENERVVLRRGDEVLHVAGLSDDRFGDPDPSILNDIPAGEALLIMAHDPAVFLDAPEGSLMVSGHMHGGQIKLPWLDPPLVPHGRAPRRWARGHIRERGGDLVVSAGLGCSGFPLRLFCPPEVVMLELLPVAAGP